MNIPYTDSNLNYLGRWTNYGTSKGSGWQGVQVRFKVSGTLNLAVNVDVQDLSGSDVSGVITNIDSGNYTQILTTSLADIYTGIKTANFTLPDTGEHTVILKFSNYPNLQWNGTGRCRLMSLDIDAGGSVTPWVKTTGRLLGCVGDSWMATANDWPFLMAQTKYWLYPISFGGARASTLDSQFNYDNSATLNTSDPTLDVVIVNSSVNDYIGGVSLSSFNTSFAALVDKIRTKQPTAKIILLQSPRNTRDGQTYDQYGPKMEIIAAARSNVVYVPCPSSVWSTLEWATGDPYHLSFAGRQTLAAYVEGQLDLLYEAKSRGYIIC